MTGILWFLTFQVIGILCAWFLLRQRRVLIRIWIGSACGSIAASWFPVPFAFVIGFNAAAQLFALLPAFLGFALCLFLSKTNDDSCLDEFNDSPLFLMLPVFLLICVPILLSHTLKTGPDGLYTGQCTYGDMCMHLGFIQSLAVQGIFPPEYNILPGTKLCYPFLCDSISSSLVCLGSSLRTAYMFPMLFALAQVFSGVWVLSRQICKSTRSAILAVLFFFLNGGFGMLYFIKEHSLYELFNGFYITPTNLTSAGIRWVNITVDMLLPQRATLFGWAALMVCMYLLYMAVFEDDSRYFLPAGILGGLLPMIHTHSYLALGLVAFSWLVITAIQRPDELHSLFIGWLKFGIPAILLALPQLLEWTLQSASGNSQFLRQGLDWVNHGKENWFVFWIKNVGLLFILFPFAYFTVGRRMRTCCSAAIFIFVLCELIIFQPNVYDNNKLLYIGYLFVCFLCADFIDLLLNKLPHRELQLCTLGLVLIICTNAAIFTLGRELLSGTYGRSYRLFSNSEVSAAGYILEETAPDALFLTTDRHNNPVAVLTGRNILCGSPSYLFFHGLDYSDTLQLQKEMLADSQVFEANWRDLGLDYVYIGPSERQYGLDLEQWLTEHYPAVFSEATATIYKLR